MRNLTLAELRERASQHGAKKFPIDSTEHSAVLVCLRGVCDWRYGALNRASALQEYAIHCRSAHDDFLAAETVTA
jgi:hypothetical protein